MVKDDLTTDVHHLADHAHEAPRPHAGDIGREPLARPPNRVVCARSALGHHRLRFTALLGAFGHPQAVRIAFEGRVDPTPALSIAGHIGQPHRHRVVPPVHRLPTPRDHLVGLQGREPHPHALWPVVLATAPRDSAHRAAIHGGSPRHPAPLTRSEAGLLPPVGHTLRQALRPCARIVRAMDVLVVSQPPVDICHTPAPGIHAPHRSAALALIERQRRFRGLHPRLERAGQVPRAPAEALDDEFVIPGGHDPSPLPSPPMTLMSQGACGGKRGLVPARHAAPIRIQPLQALVIIVAIAPPMTPIDRVQGAGHGRDIGRDAGLEGILHHRGRGPRLPATGRRPAGGRPQACGDCHDALGTGQDRDQGLRQFLPRGVGDRLLAKRDVVTPRPQQVEPVQASAKGSSRRTGRNPGC
jgi:hypothetical protein